MVVKYVDVEQIFLQMLAIELKLLSSRGQRSAHRTVPTTARKLNENYKLVLGTYLKEWLRRL